MTCFYFNGITLVCWCTCIPLVVLNVWWFFAWVYLNKEVKIQIQMDFHLFDQFLPDFSMISGLKTVHYYKVFRFIYDIYQLISTGFLAALTLSHITVRIKTCSNHQKNKKANISQAFQVPPPPRHSSFVVSLFQFSCDLSDSIRNDNKRRGLRRR